MDKVPFPIPADFALRASEFAPAEIAAGLTGGWITPSTAVALAEDATRHCTGPAIYGFASLLPTEYDEALRFALRLQAGRFGPYDPTQATRIWQYLSIAYVDTRLRDKNLLETIEVIYATFGYPSSMAHLARYTPAPRGLVGSPELVVRLRREYLETNRRLFGRGARLICPPDPL